MTITAAEIAERARGELAGDPAARIRGVAPLDAAGPEDLSFVASARYLAKAESTRAGVVLLPQGLECSLPPGVARIHVDDPYRVLAWLLPELYPEPPLQPGIHPTAVVAEDAEIGEGARVEPYVVVGSGARIGACVHLGAHVLVGDGCVLGEDTVVHPHVTIHPGVVIGRRCVIHSGARLGGEGFRFLTGEAGATRIPQLGGLEIGDDVEVGANTTIDRGALESTTVGAGTKMDNLVQIGHNCRVGRNVLLVAQVGISGSTTIGDGAILGGQAGVGGHLTLGAGARVGGKAGVTGDVAPGETVSGYPARPHAEAMRAQAALHRLPAMFKKLQELERLVRGKRD